MKPVLDNLVAKLGYEDGDMNDALECFERIMAGIVEELKVWKIFII